MAKQLNVNLAFTADTSQAKAQLQSLQTQLSGLLNSTNGQSFGNQITGDINKASKAIAELKLHLQNATNVNTGNLDFTKLNESLNKSGTTLQQYGDKLRSLGPAGQQAFNTLASSIAQSEIPIRRSNAALTEMWTTLKNTARWQISSSILHGFMGSISAAVGYAKDLNKSLNDIRIVTNASVDEMARFAEQANRSAKALSASTTEYTKASLIYYQQGLDDQAVKERTDVTIKMANVSGQTAEMVSDQMTAVWNNFAKGSEDLERFADVMVRLGADTASSSDEIAQGLEKFAAIGDMVGLSFNNAAAALATVTATTRQSADVVGTAFKTIFARIQGLKLGETLEDGTDLNKYSEALATVGISIKEQNGELKDMDNILAEMGAKWKTLSKDQQVALAQTVAGLRQYNQLVALMENFDFYEQNLQSAENAEGSLQKQADIYAESWQAASDRVKAATQGIYEDLLNDEAFIDVLNIIEKILTYVDNLIDGLGGLGGVLTTVGVLLTRAFSAQIAQGITSMTNSIKMMTAAGREQAQQQKAQFMKDSADAMRSMSDGSNEGNMHATMMEEQLRLQQSMIENSEKMSIEEQQVNQMLLDRQRILGENAIAAAKELDAVKENKSDVTMQARTDIAATRLNAEPNETGTSKTIKQLNADFTALQGKMKQQIKVRIDLQDLIRIQQEGMDSKDTLEKLKQIVSQIDNKGLNSLVNSLQQIDLEGEEAEATITELLAIVERMTNSTTNKMLDLGIDDETVTSIVSSLEQEEMAEREVEEATRFANQARDEVANSINNATGAQKTWADQMVAGANVVMSIMSALQALNGIIDVATNPDMSGWEKFLSIGSSLAMMFVMLAPLLSGTNLQFLAMASSTVAAKVGLKGASLAALEASAATGTLSASLWTLLWPIGLVMAAIAALVLVVGGLIKLFKSFDEGEKLKKLEEEAQHASEAFDRTKEKINETKTALDSLESGYETIEKLKEGTLEWYEAIGNVNAEVMKLAETYPDLAQYISSDNGVLKISDEGQDYLSQEMGKQYATAANYKMSTQIRVNDQKFEMGKSDYVDPTGGLLMVGADNYQKTTQLMQAAYETPEIGETLFTGTGAKKFVIENNRESIKAAVDSSLGYDYKAYSQGAREHFVNALSTTVDWSDTKAIEQAAQKAFRVDSFEEVDFSSLSERLLAQKNNMEMLLSANEEHIKGQKALKDSNKRLQDAQFESVLSSMGSTRTADEGKELLDGKTYEDIKIETKSSVAETVNKGGFGGWQDYDNYTGNEEWIQDFMKQMGASDYVAQRGGNMVLKIEGEEKEFSKDEVVNTLTDMYSTGAAQEEITKAMASSVHEAYKISTKNLKPEDLVNLDNLAIGIKEGLSQGFQGSEEELAQTTNTLTQAIGQTYGSDSEALAADTQYINFDDSEIQEKIIKLAEGLDGTTEKAAAFKQELKEINELGKIDSMTSTFDEAAEALGGSKDEIAQTSAQMQRYAKHLMGVSKNSKTLSDDLADNAEAAADVATATVQMNKGIDKLSDGIEDWSSIINNSSKESVEYCDAMFEIKDAMSDVLGVSADFLSDDFIINNMKDIELAAQGDAEAIDRLAIAAGKDILVNLDIADESVREDLLGLHEELATMIPDLKMRVGAELTGTDNFITKANEIVQKAGMTAEEANRYFRSMGFTPHFKMIEASQAESVPLTTTHHKMENIVYDEYNNPISWEENEYVETKQVPGGELKTALPSLTMEDGQGNMPKVPSSVIESMTVTNSGSMNNYSSSNSGGNSPGSSGGSGGGGNPKPKKPTKAKTVKPTEKKEKDDEIERYKEITEVLDDLNNELDEIGKLKDEAWGPDKLKVMDQEIAKYKQLATSQQTYISAVEDKLKSDREAAEAIGMTFDEFDRITNYDEAMEAFINEYNNEMARLDAEEQAYETRAAEIANTEYGEGQEQQQWADEDANEAKMEKITADREAAEKLFEDRVKTIEQYTDTLNLSEEAKRQYEEYLRQMRQLNYEKITYKVEFQIELSEVETSKVDYYLDKFADDLYMAAERSVLYGDKINPITKMLEANYTMIDELEEKYKAGEIDKSQYMEGLEEAQSNMIDNISELEDLLEEVGEYYLNTLDQVNEKLDIQTEKFDNLGDKLQHYKDMTILINGEKDYKSLEKIIKAEEKVVNAQLATSERRRQMLETQRADIKAKIAEAANIEDESVRRKMIENLEGDLNEVEALIVDEESKMMEALARLGEIAMEELTNTLAQAKEEMQKTLFDSVANQKLGISDIESMIDHINKLNGKQEEYLTNTNKLYQTNKLIRQAQMDMDKTTNLQAKQQYADYVKYIEKLQKSGELSQFELELAKADYDILQKKIALEEAQDAKNQVRLTRDSEGNFGYVYTANQDNIAKAEQEFADAQNARYNIALEGAQKYQDQYYQAIADMQDELDNLEQQRAENLITTTEYDRRVAEVTKYYLDIAQQASELYETATGAMIENSAKKRLDYTLQGVGDMETLRDATEKYLGDAQIAFDTYDLKIDNVRINNEEDFGLMKDAVEDVADKAEELEETITDTLIPALENELSDTLDNSKTEWLNLASAIKSAREEVEKYMEAIGEDIAKNTIEDYSLEIQDLVEDNKGFNDKKVQDMLKLRWEKMGGNDTYNYQALMDQHLANGGKETDSWYKTLEILRQYKILMTDYSNNDAAWAQEIRDEKLEQNYAGMIIDYMKNPQAKWKDNYVQQLLAIRSSKIAEKGWEDKYPDNEELKEYVADLIGRPIDEMKTGGYTGAWGPEGKLAVLHEKELVLNAEDTKNFLSATNILREISQMLDRDALVASLGAINISALTLDSPADQVLQQEVTIHADFPNVTDHNEIELAIDNLINAASQHAYKA